MPESGIYTMVFPVAVLWSVCDYCKFATVYKVRKCQTENKTIVRCKGRCNWFFNSHYNYDSFKIKDEYIWQSVREDYARLSKLCAVLNASLGNMISLVLANNTMMLLNCCYQTIMYVKQHRKL